MIERHRYTLLLVTVLICWVFFGCEELNQSGEAGPGPGTASRERPRDQVDEDGGQKASTDDSKAAVGDRVGFVAGSAEGGAELVFRLSENEQYRQRIDMESDVKTPMGIPNVDHKKSTLILDCRVVGFDEEKRARVEVTIKRVRVSTKSLSFYAQYDSEDKEAEAKKQNKKQQRFRKVFAGLAGLKYTALVDRRGRIVELVDVDGRIQRAMSGKSKSSLPGEDQLTLLFTEDNLRDGVAPPLFGALPDGRIKPGTTWRDRQAIRASYSATAQAKRKYKLERYETDKNGKQAAVISYHGFLLEKGAEKQRGQGKGMEIVQAATRGSIRYSVTDGELIAMTESLRVEIRAAQSDRESTRRKTRGKNKIYYDMERTIRPLANQKD